MKFKETILLIILYSILIIGFGFWWAGNFTVYRHIKGDESFLEIEFVAAITLIALIIFRIINQKLSWWFIVIMPFLSGLLSIFVLLFIPLFGVIDGTTDNDLRFYGIVHTLLTIIIVFFQLHPKNRAFSRKV